MKKLKLLSGFFKNRSIIYRNELVKPTIFIIRKILFSWLENYIKGARVLDLFGGSGILGFEALSRGASFLFIIEKSDIVCKDLYLNIFNLNIKNVQLININVFEWLNLIKFIPNYIKSFDIIFIDSPYNSNYLFCCLDMLFFNDYIYNDSYIYIETCLDFEKNFCTFNYKILKYKIIGVVRFYIIQKF